MKMSLTFFSYQLDQNIFSLVERQTGIPLQAKNVHLIMNKVYFKNLWQGMLLIQQLLHF